MSRAPAVVDVSVIIPARNAERLLPAQLRAIGRQVFEGSFEVLVVDNGSSDATADTARRHAPEGVDLRVIDAPAGIGVNHSRNRGAEEARGEFLAYVDADDEVCDGWLAAMAAAGREADVVGGALDQRSLNPDHSFRWQPELTVDGPPTSLGFLPYAVGANVGVRASVLDAVGGWDEAYVSGANDVELSWRAQLAGYRFAFAPDAGVRYRHRSGSRAVLVRAIRHDRANAQLFRQYRDRGAHGRSMREALVSWAWLPRNLPALLRGPGERENWFRELGGAFGRLWGSVEHRVWFL